MSDSLVRVSRRTDWGAHRPMPRSTQMPRHTETMRATYHDCIDGISASISTTRALVAAAIRIDQCPKPIGGLACDRFTFDRASDRIYRPIGAEFTTRGVTGSGHNGALTLSGATFQWTWARSTAEDASPDYNLNTMGTQFSSWAIPGLLAVTRGILLSFFSSAY
ncbi:hypothetical protein GBA52_025975 [Prunus armeniaca]|nr:hypothetical protein GBA52_025975 [Prunus armeniaca]